MAAIFTVAAFIGNEILTKVVFKLFPGTDRSDRQEDFSMSTLEYKGHKGTINFSAEDNCFHGKLLDVNDLVTYEASDAEMLEEEFRLAVNEYIKE